jgi:multiple sugar transport system permease protein
MRVYISKPEKYLTYVLLIVISIAAVLPYIWLMLTSVKFRVDIFTLPPKWIFQPTLKHYKVAFIDKGFSLNLLNTVIISVCSTVIVMIIGVPCAYAFSRFKLKGDTYTFFSFLLSRMTPIIVVAVPIYLLMRSYHLLGTRIAVILTHIIYNLSYVIWMMKGFFDVVPRDLDEAALIDGNGFFGAFIRVTLPLTAPGLASTAIFCLVMSWNEFLYALIFSSRASQTLAVAIPALVTPRGTFWGQLAAVAAVTTIPVLVFSFSIQRYMIKGLTMGAVKS